MAEYIEHTCGECIHAEICEHLPTLTGWDACNPTYCRGFRNAADVVEVKHGKWREADDGDGAVCSVCGEDFCNIYLEVDRFNYCPNCGAKMT